MYSHELRFELGIINPHLFHNSLFIGIVFYSFCVPVTSRFFLQVQFVDDSKLTAVNRRDFFLHAFNELLAPDSGMFMYNDSETMIWFPAKVRTITHNAKLSSVNLSHALINILNALLGFLLSADA